MLVTTVVHDVLLVLLWYWACCYPWRLSITIRVDCAECYNDNTAGNTDSGCTLETPLCEADQDTYGDVCASK